MIMHAELEIIWKEIVVHFQGFGIRLEER